MALPANITPTIVNWAWVGDDGTPATGTVTWVISKGTYLTDVGEATILPSPVVCTLGIEGELIDPDGTTGVKLIANDDPNLSDGGSTWDCTEDLTVTDKAGQEHPFTRTRTFVVPSGGPFKLDALVPAAPAGAGADLVVLSVNEVKPNAAGDVVLAAADVHALPDTYTPPAAPVQSVAGKTGAVTLTAGDVGAIPADAVLVETVNGISGPAVVLDAQDVGAEPVQPPADLGFAAVIATDASVSSHFRVTLTGDAELDNPTGLRPGQKVLWELVQDAVGGHALTLGTMFVVSSEVGAVILSSAPGARDFVGGIYNELTNKIYVVALARGFVDG